jgi:TPR repeat protein
MSDQNLEVSIVPVPPSALVVRGPDALARRALSDLQALESAEEWFEKAEEAWAEGGLEDLGGIKGRLQESIEYYRRVVELNPLHFQALARLGEAYCAGSGVAQDYVKAEEFIRRAAYLGYATAQYTLGWMYQTGRGIARDLNQAVAWYRNAANHGYDEAQRKMGMMYESGQGVAKDLRQAMEWYLRAANQNNTEAQWKIGLMYALGESVPVNPSQAAVWFQKAAHFGIEFIRPWLGTPFDLTEAEGAKSVFHLLKGHASVKAQHRLGLAHVIGSGVPRDETKAAAWIYLATLADEAFRESWNQVTKRLTSRNIADAKKLAHDWVAGCQQA